MDSRIKILGHPVHQMLIPFPMGLLGTAVVFDVIYLIFRNPTMATVSYWMMLAGVVGGLIAAPFGFADWRMIPPNTRAKRVGVVHGLGNVLVVILFGLSLLGRTADPAHMIAHVLSFAGFALALLTGWTEASSSTVTVLGSIAARTSIHRTRYRDVPLTSMRRALAFDRTVARFDRAG